MGYQTKASLGNSYFKFVVPTFNTTSGGTMTLEDIALVYDGDDATAQRIWTLTKGGATDKAYYYVNEAAAEFESVDVGWYTDTSFKTSAKGVKIPFGQGFALVAASDTTCIRFAGQVETTEFADVIGGSIFNFSGNFSPLPMTLKDIALIYDGDDATAQRIWTLTKGGATDKAYYYVNEAAAEFESVDVGWYTDTSFKTSANDITLEAGDGFAVVAASAIQIKVPSAL